MEGAPACTLPLCHTPFNCACRFEQEAESNLPSFQAGWPGLRAPVMSYVSKAEPQETPVFTYSLVMLPSTSLLGRPHGRSTKAYSTPGQLQDVEKCPTVLALPRKPRPGPSYPSQPHERARNTVKSQITAAEDYCMRDFLPPPW